MSGWGIGDRTGRFDVAPRGNQGAAPANPMPASPRGVVSAELDQLAELAFALLVIVTVPLLRTSLRAYRIERPDASHVMQPTALLRCSPQTHVCNDHEVEQRISLITLGVSDLVRARAFYEALGWAGAQQPDEEVCFFQAGGMVFGLWTALGGHGAPGIELAHNVRSPEEVTRLLNEAEQAGGSIIRPAAVADWGGTTGAFADPEGYVWEVAHNPGWTLADDGTVHI